MRFIRYFLVTVLFLVAGIVYSREVPKVKIWILNKIQLVSREKADMEIKAKVINFKFFPPGVELQGLSIVPRGDLASMISPTTVDSLSLFLSPASLIAGRFEIGNIDIEHPVTNLFFRKKPAAAGMRKNEESSGRDIYDQVISIPLKGITVNRAEIRARVESADAAIQLRNFSFHAEKNYSAAKADIFAPDVVIKKDSSVDSIALGLATRVILEREALEIAALKITQGTNYVIAGGVGRGDTVKLDFPFVNGRTLAHLDIQQAENLARIFDPSLNLPNSTGELNFEVVAKQDRGQDPHLLAEIDTKDLKVGKFVVGDVHTRLIYASNILTSKEVKVANASGHARFQDLEIHLGKEIKFSARTFIDDIELHQLLENLAVHAPVRVDLKGVVPCEGTVSPDFRIECAGELTGSQFLLDTKLKHKTVVALKQFKIAANMTIEKDKITFPHALISIGDSQGAANGQVDYDKGFSFYYHTDKLDFADVESLADLKLVGGLAISGTTSGTGHTGVINAEISSPNFWFEDYGLGSIGATLGYEAGFLKFTNVKGENGSTQYDGNMNILIDDDAGDHQVGIKSATLNLPTLDLADLPVIFARKVTLPFTMNGAGSGKVLVSGPFSLSKLSYTVTGGAKRGMIAGESFNEAHFNFHGVNGHAYADNISVKRNDGSLALTGDVLPTGMMNVLIHGQNLRLSDSEHARTYAPGLDARLNIDMTMADFILRPRTHLSGVLSQTTLNQHLLEDSDFDMTFTPGSMTLNGQLFAKKLTTHLVYPYRGDEPFSFKFETTNWDFSNILGFAGGTTINRDYETSLTAKVDLSSKEGGLWKSHGSAAISKLYVRHGTSQMKNNGPLEIRFDDGDVTVTQFKLEGDNTQMAVTGSKNKKDVLNFNVNGRMDLSLLTFMTPFLREMTGEISVSTQIGGTLYHPDLLGSAFLKDGFFRLEALPQPFEGISADLLFSQQKVLINRMAGKMGGGNLTAGGGITFQSFGDIPVELTGDLVGTHLTIPDGLATRGDFHFSISGNWFPYLLKGEYIIDEGEYTKNFEDEESDTALKRSSLLPTIILQKNFSPVDLDVSAHFHKGVKVVNTTMDADMKGDLEITGDPAHTIFKGDVEASPGGKIFFNGTPFTITDCRVKFNNPTENNPVLYAAATTHVRDWDVNLLLQGTKTKYRLELSSSPPLPEKSIISLLALGVTEEDEFKTTQKQVFSTSFGAPSGSATQNPTVDASTQNLGEGVAILSQKIKPLTDIKQQYGVNVKFSNTVDETLNVVLPTVTAEKSWSPKFTTSVSRTVGDYNNSDVKAEYKLDRHFSVLGSYENRDPKYYNLGTTSTTSGQNSTLPLDIFGVDLQYQIEFK